MTRGTSHRTARARLPERACTSGVRPASAAAPDMPRLLGALAHLKVRDLARLGEMSLEQLAAKVIEASALPRLQNQGTATRPAGKKRRLVRMVAAPLGSWAPPTEPPALEGLLGRIKLRELDALVDYWALSVTLREHEWNVTHAAAHLGTSRRALRVHWRMARNLSPDLVALAWSGHGRPWPSLPAPPPLATMLADGVRLATIRNAARQWLVTCTLELRSGNRSQAAENLGTTRRSVREHLASYTATQLPSGTLPATPPSSSTAHASTRHEPDAVTGGQQ